MRTDLYRDIEKQEKDHWWHINKKRLVKNLIEKFQPPKKLEMLDVGCGTGMVMETLSSLGKVWGIDNNEAAIKICKEKGIKKVKKAPAEKIPFKENSFNLVTLLDVLEHTDEKKVLREVNRVLSRKGILILTVPSYTWMWSKWDEVLNHKKRYSKKTLVEVLQKNGFKIVKISYLYSFLLIPVFIVRKIKSLLYSKDYPSDFLISNRFINTILEIIAKLEMKYFLKKDIPFGLTLVAVAKKK